LLTVIMQYELSRYIWYRHLFSHDYFIIIFINGYLGVLLANKFWFYFHARFIVVTFKRILVNPTGNPTPIIALNGEFQVWNPLKRARLGAGFSLFITPSGISRAVADGFPYRELRRTCECIVNCKTMTKE